MKDVEVIMHAGCQQQVLMGGMPLQSPHSTTHWSLTEGLPHVSAVPQQNLLIVTEEGEESEKTNTSDSHTTLAAKLDIYLPVARTCSR